MLSSEDHANSLIVVSGPGPPVQGEVCHIMSGDDPALAHAGSHRR